jgi:hypothetical protein
MDPLCHKTSIQPDGAQLRALEYSRPNIIEDMDRRTFFRQAAAATALARVAAAQTQDLEEITLRDIADRMRLGQSSARSLTEQYLSRIDAIDRNGPALRSVIETNPDALSIADALDRERKEKGPRGPMHGIPVLIKDNIDTADRMKTTAGSLALADAPQPRDAAVVERLRTAGAVILGKTNLSEWANFRSTHSSSGWSGRGGQAHNPYALDRNPCGSSSGSGAAVAANLCVVAVGTETDGSVVCPSSINGIVGIKPTVGLVSGRVSFRSLIARTPLVRWHVTSAMPPFCWAPWPRDRTPNRITRNISIPRVFAARDSAWRVSFSGSLLTSTG